MQANDFEKRVRERMDELQLYPSASVWPEVEQRIRKEKKKRPLIFWWLLPLLLAGGALFYFSREKNKNAGDAGNTARKDMVTVKAGNKQPDNNDNPITVNKASQPAGENNTHTILPPVNNTLNDPASAAHNQQPVVLRKQHKANVKPGHQQLMPGKENIIISSAIPGKKSRRRVSPVDNKAALNNDEPAAKKELLATPVAQSKTTVAETAAPVTAAILSKPALDENKKPVDSVSVTSNNLKATDTVSSTANINTTAPAKKKKKHQWETGISFSGGYAERIKGDLNIGSEKTADVQTNSFGSPGAFLAQPPGEMTGGLYLQAGMYARKTWGKKTYTRTGILWSMYTIKQRTGVLVNNQTSSSGMTPIGNTSYYYSGNSNQYISRYHQFSIPVQIGWQLNKGKKTPIEWENGFSVGFIPFTKNLVYNSTRNIYYRDDKQLHRWQFYFTSMLNIRLFPDAVRPVTIGAGINYHLSPLQKSVYESRNRLYSYGIRVGLTLKK